tara:strand:+ start:12802 stop:13575 length:774 start_codon:yes stop_codon:yes gene_type:complete
MQPLTLSFLQTDTVWHDPAANREQISGWLDLLPEDSRLVILPEMFSTGFTMAATEVAEPMDGPTVGWMRQEARARGVVICGSVVISEGGHSYNRFIWAAPDRVATYDKRHLFRMAGEHHHYASGTQRLVVQLDGWRICPVICYDLRFPVWLRNRDDYDLMLCPANWPAPRAQAWDGLLKARAIENLSYVVGVNIIGVDGNGVGYSGGSVVYGPEGESLLHAQDGRGVFTVTLSGENLLAYRKSFPAWQDADDFQLTE